MQRVIIATLTSVSLMAGTASTGAPPALADTPATPAATSCEAKRVHYSQRLDRKIMPSWLKNRYQGAVFAAYGSCRSDQASARDRVERMLG